MSSGLRLVDLVGSPNAEFSFVGPWTRSQNVGDSGYTINSSGLMRFGFEGSEIHVFGHYSMPLGQEKGIPALNCDVDEKSAEIRYGADGDNTFECLWNGTDATGGAHEFGASVAFALGTAGIVQASIDAVHYLPSASRVELLTQGAAVVFNSSDPHIDFRGNWETLREGDEAVAVTSIQGTSMTAIFDGSSAAWYGWLPLGTTRGQSRASYMVDGGGPVTFEWNSTISAGQTRRRKEYFRVIGLSNEVHNLTVVHQDSQLGPPLVFDYLEVGNGQYRIAADRPKPANQGSRSGGPASPSDSAASSIAARATPIGAIVGGIIGALVVIASFTLALFWAKKRRWKSDPDPSLNPRTTVSLSNPASFAPISTYRKGEPFISTQFLRPTVNSDGSTFQGSSVNLPSIAHSGVRHKGNEETGTLRSELGSGISSMSREHQDSGVRVNGSRRSSLPPVYTVE